MPYVFIPEGHAVLTFPVPTAVEDMRDDAAKILDEIAGPLRGASAHVIDTLDEGDDG